MLRMLCRGGIGGVYKGVDMRPGWPYERYGIS